MSAGHYRTFQHTKNKATIDFRNGDVLKRKYSVVASPLFSLYRKLKLQFCDYRKN
jgi:hypothetical protein